MSEPGTHDQAPSTDQPDLVSSTASGRVIPTSRRVSSARSDQVRAWSAGMNLASGLIAGCLIGWVVDNIFGTSPWWLLGLGLAGLASGTWRFMREAIAMNQEVSRRYRRNHPASGVEAKKPGADNSPGG